MTDSFATNRQLYAAATALPMQYVPVPLAQCYRLLNHGPTVLVSAAHAGEANAMAAAWACALDFAPPKVTVVLDKQTRTRQLVEASGAFVLQLPTQAQAQLTLDLGSRSAHTEPDKLARCGASFLRAPEAPDAPLVAGCAAWLVCKLIAEPHNQNTYDLFIGEVTHAWADVRVFSHGRWTFDDAPNALRTLHYVAGGQFYVTGESLQLPSQDNG